MKRKTKEEFIENARKIHGDDYIYTDVVYKNTDTKVCIICPEHGEFWQTPHDHLGGHGCPKCKAAKLKELKGWTQEQFIEHVKQVHGDNFDYSKVEYKGFNNKVCIICPKHGEFYILPSHLLNGTGCKKCYDERRGKTQLLTLEEFIERAKQIHGDLYDYSKVVYVNTWTKVCIICPIHGEFWITPHNHLQGYGCQKCGGTYKKTTEEFIDNAKKVHGDKYIYDESEYFGIMKPIKIICPIHGEFWQVPKDHLSGCGCPKCSSSKLENEIRLFLTLNNIEFEEQKTFDFLGQLRLDYFLPEYNAAIECQGIQHFKPIEYFGGEESLMSQIKRDNNKRQLCEKKGIKLLYYSNLHIDYPYKVYENKEELLEIIQHANNTNLS